LEAIYETINKYEVETEKLMFFQENSFQSRGFISHEVFEVGQKMTKNESK